MSVEGRQTQFYEHYALDFNEKIVVPGYKGVLPGYVYQMIFDKQEYLAEFEFTDHRKIYNEWFYMNSYVKPGEGDYSFRVDQYTGGLLKGESPVQYQIVARSRTKGLVRSHDYSIPIPRKAEFLTEPYIMGSLDTRREYGQEALMARGSYMNWAGKLIRETMAENEEFDFVQFIVKQKGQGDIDTIFWNIDGLQVKKLWTAVNKKIAESNNS